MTVPPVAAIVIGRNEGDRLAACLDSLSGQAHPVIYVDSGSTDGSVTLARERGAQVVELEPDRPFTAARARNAGVQALATLSDTGAPDRDGGARPPACVQFVDGDCIVAPGWIETGRAALEADAGLAVVCGRRRELAPEASVWNRLIDREWDTPVGEARACGGDALMRRAAFDAVGGFDGAVIAGEEPELCVRLRAAGWRIRRLDAEMTRHDAALTRFSQWWTRARRAGYAYAQGAALHGAPPERHCVAELRRAVVWGGLLPALTVLLALAGSLWATAPPVAYGAQILRLWARSGDLAQAAALTVTKPAEALGALAFARDRLTKRRARIIEYK